MSEKMNRRNFLPLAGAGAIMAPTILTSCSAPTAPDPISIPGTIVFQRTTSSGSDIYIMDWSAETQINLTADIPGNHGRPFWGPDGMSLYFDSEVDGKSSISRISDLANPAGSLETIVDEEGHQIHPQVHPDGNLLVYSQTTGMSVISNGLLVAYDLNSDQEISRTTNCIIKVGDNSFPVDRDFLPGERTMIVTGVPGVGIYHPDTGVVEPYVLSNNPNNVTLNSVAVCSNGTTCYGIGMSSPYPSELALSLGDFDTIAAWDLQGEGSVRSVDVNGQENVKTRVMGDLI